MEDNKDNINTASAENTEATEAECESTAKECGEKKCKKAKPSCEKELAECTEALKKSETALKESEEKYLRLLAEYDNFRKRTAKEKEAIYSDAYGDALKEILPILDTLEMAAGYSGDKVAEGVKMTLTQFKDTITKLGIEEIPAEVGGEFNPELHNAVMNAQNPELPEGSIAMILRKGYKKGDKVYRYTMVAVNG